MSGTLNIISGIFILIGLVLIIMTISFVVNAMKETYDLTNITGIEIFKITLIKMVTPVLIGLIISIMLGVFGSGILTALSGNIYDNYYDSYDYDNNYY